MGLSASTIYNVQVWAVNTAGFSPVALTGQFTTLALSPHIKGFTGANPSSANVASLTVGSTNHYIWSVNW